MVITLGQPLVYPSHYEGFGWLPLEAQACGCPVIASNGGSLLEILGESALTCEPLEEEIFVRNLDSVLSSETLREELRRKGYDRGCPKNPNFAN